MKTKSLIAGISTVIAMTAGLSSPAFAEYNVRNHYSEKDAATQVVKRAAPSKKAPAEHRRSINMDESYLNTP